MVTLASASNWNADIFVASAGADGNASDSNDGQGPSRPFATLSAAQTAATNIGNGVRIGLTYGSKWRETLDLRSVNNVTVQAHGNRAKGLPEINGSDEIVGAWDDSTDRGGDGFSNVYSQSYSWDTRDPSWLAAWENDVRLVWAASISECNNTPGSFYIPTAAGQTTDSPQTLYVHPYGSTNPNNDNKKYEAVKRPVGLWVGDNSLVKHLRGLRCGINRGHITSGDNTRLIGCIGHDHVRHEILLWSGRMDYCVGWTDHNDNRAGQILLEFARDNAAGYKGHWENCVSVSTGSVVDGFGGHGGADGEIYDSWTLNRCALKGTRLGGDSVKNVYVDKLFVEDGAISVNSEGDGRTDVIDPYFRITSDTGVTPFRIVSTPNPYTVDGLRAYLTDFPNDRFLAIYANDADVTLENSVIVDAGGSDRRRSIWDTTTGPATFDITRSVLDYSRNTASFGQENWVEINKNDLYTASENIYWPDSNDKLEFRIEGALYEGASFYLAAQQPSKESGSQAADPQLVDPFNGDFTIGNGSLPSDVGLERDPTCQNYTPIPATLADAEQWILDNT